MTVKWKVTALIAALFAVLGVAEIFVAKDVLMPSFSELESKEASIAMRRVQYGMELTLDQLAVNAGSWGNWNDAYRFAQDHNQAFIDEQVTPPSLKQLNLNALLVIDLAGNVLASNTIELPPNCDHPLAGRTKTTANHNLKFCLSFIVRPLPPCSRHRDCFADRHALTTQVTCELHDQNAVGNRDAHQNHNAHQRHHVQSRASEPQG